MRAAALAGSTAAAFASVRMTLAVPSPPSTTPDGTPDGMPAAAAVAMPAAAIGADDDDLAARAAPGVAGAKILWCSWVATDACR